MHLVFGKCQACADWASRRWPRPYRPEWTQVNGTYAAAGAGRECYHTSGLFSRGEGLAAVHDRLCDTNHSTVTHTTNLLAL